MAELCFLMRVFSASEPENHLNPILIFNIAPFADPLHFLLILCTIDAEIFSVFTILH